MRKFFVLLPAMLIFVLTGCSGKESNNRQPKKNYESAINKETFSNVESNTIFALKMYDYWAQKSINKNIFFSPYSVSVALAMVYPGGSGKTADQMKNALHFCCDGSKTAELFAELSNAITTNFPSGKTSISIINGLWKQKDYPFLAEYIGLLKNSFSPQIKSVDFKKNTEKIRRNINKWVESKTNNKIKDIIVRKALTPASRLVLVNAIYFKSPWLEKFDKNLTEHSALFYGLEKKLKVEMMQNTGRYKIAFHKMVKVLKMPYERDKFAMYIILPNKRNSIGDIERLLDIHHLDKWMSAMSFKKVAVKFPKLRIERGLGLIAMFKAMGMTDAFTLGKANFSGMDGTRHLYVSEIAHKAFCDIDEEGTEAAAATAVVMDLLSAALQPEKIYEFTADHPFIFLIRNEKTKSILFAGRFMGPGL